MLQDIGEVVDQQSARAAIIAGKRATDAAETHDMAVGPATTAALAADTIGQITGSSTAAVQAQPARAASSATRTMVTITPAAIADLDIPGDLQRGASWALQAQT